MKPSQRSRHLIVAAIASILPLASPPAHAASPDPQVQTDHPWYPGELSCSTFPRLFKTEAELYRRVTGRSVATDEDKALAAWYWRNLHYAHGEEGAANCFAGGFAKADKTRDYWLGLFAHGFALCGTTHAQWTAEMDALLGHARSRVVGVSGHNSFEVYLTGGAYGSGKWALLDHDISTVMYDDAGSRLLSLQEIVPRIKTLKDPRYKPERQHGWRVSGLHDDDAGGVYTSYNTAEYLAGYAGPPPMVNLRPGESLRRYLNPGLDDGKTFVYWGRNYNAGGIPGPMRDRAWVNQPEKMYGSKNGTGYHMGQVRYANAVYTYAPDFANATYKEGVVDESPDHVTFEFQTPYVIASTPANDKPWGNYDPGGKNGLVLHGSAKCPVRISIDQGKTWSEPVPFSDGLDLSDIVKGEQQYWLRFDAPAAGLANENLSWRTVCECNVAIIPHLHDGTNRVTFAASGRALLSAGPNIGEAEAHLVAGKITASGATLELTAPRGEKPVHIYAASWNNSGAPPAPVNYRIDYSTDGGKTWEAVVKDWKVQRRAPEPKDFWSQSFCWGDVELPANAPAGPVRVRFSNDGGKSYRKVEAHLAYQVTQRSTTQVTFAWKDAGGQVQTAIHTYRPEGGEDKSWSFSAGTNPEMQWVEYRCP
jgi:hypothetical protein